MSHEFTKTFEIDGRFLNVPTAGFKNDDEAIDHFILSRPGVPGFKTEEQAIASAKERSKSFDAPARFKGLNTPRRVDDPVRSTFARDEFEAGFEQFIPSAFIRGRRLGGGIQSILEIEEINRARGADELDGPSPGGVADFLIRTYDAHTKRLEELQPRSAILSADEANTRFGIPGHLKFSNDVTFEEADILHEKKLEEIRFQDVLERTRGFANNAAVLSTEMLSIALDPINIGALFIPVVGPARYAQITARYGLARGRAIVGAIEGSVGTALTEPLALAGTAVTHADYTAYDAILNVVFGTALGAGLHPLALGIGDRIRKRRAPTIQDAAPEVVDNIRAEIREEIASIPKESTELKQKLEGMLSRVDEASKTKDIGEFSRVIDDVDESLQQSYRDAIEEVQSGVDELIETLGVKEPAKSDRLGSQPSALDRALELSPSDMSKLLRRGVDYSRLLTPEGDLLARQIAIGQMVTKGKVDVTPVVRSDKAVRRRKRKKRVAARIETKAEASTPKELSQLETDLVAQRGALMRSRLKSSKHDKKNIDKQVKNIDSQLDSLRKQESGEGDLGIKQQPRESESLVGISQTERVKRKSTSQPKVESDVIDNKKFIKIRIFIF